MYFSLFSIASLCAVCVQTAPAQRAVAACVPDELGQLYGAADDAFQVAADNTTVQFASATPTSLIVQFYACSATDGTTSQNGYFFVPAQNACIYVNEKLILGGDPISATPVYELQVRNCSLATAEVGYKWIKSDVNYYWNGTTTAGVTQNEVTCASGEFGYTRGDGTVMGQNVTLGCSTNATHQPFVTVPLST